MLLDIDFSRLLTFFERTYYTDLLMLISEISAIVIWFLYAKKNALSRWFVVYISFDFLVLLFGWYLHIDKSYDKAFRNSFFNLTNNLISLTELLVYCYFFYQLLQGRIVRSYLKTISILFILITIAYLFDGFTSIASRYNYLSHIVMVIEFVFLIIPCVVYYIRLFENISLEPLLKRPSFWIVTGLLFYCCISIPYYLLSNYISKNTPGKIHQVSSALFFNIPYAIHFIIISKAFLCKKPLTT
jgi:hypothetical protein